MTIGRHWGKREAVPERKEHGVVVPECALMEDRAFRDDH